MPRPSLLAFAAVSSLAATAAFAEPRLAKHTQELAVHVSPDFEGACSRRPSDGSGSTRWLGANRRTRSA